MNEELDNTIILTDERGVDQQFAFLDLVEYLGSRYVVLLPLPDDESGEVIILRVDSDEDEEEMERYSSVDDDITLQAVFTLFRQHYEAEE